MQTMKKCNFNIANRVISETTGQKVSFKYVVDRYSVSKEQLTADMKDLRYSLEKGVIYFDLKQIRARYQPDSYKLETLGKVEAMKKEMAAIPKNRRL